MKIVKNKGLQTNGLKDKMTKEELVEHLIKNENTNFEESDRKDLLAMNVNVLAKLIPVENKEDEDESEDVVDTTDYQENAAADDEEEAEEEMPPKKKGTKPACNNQPAPAKKTVKQYIEDAPAEIQAVLRNSLSIYNAEKKRLINTITANENNLFSKEQLDVMDVGHLRNIAALAKNAAPAEDAEEVVEDGEDYSGQAMTGNTEGDEADVLDLPVLNFDKEKK